ncbi:MAG: rubrerythrin family protein [Verrucomicrobia bacterium]|nr:rubrerythrin family protein [Verrucomicrobiota bacterium]
MKKIILFLLAIAAIPAFAASSASPQTIKNLNTAFQGESNASERYAAFAKKADSDGLPQVAKLFRAASAAEAIHRDNHKDAIIKLGGEVESFKLDEVKPSTTAENIKAAIKGESYERDTMYPEFLAVAKADGAKAAIRTFQLALAVEKQHALLYQNALDNLGKNAPGDYYVCQVCGATLSELPAKNCPVCRNGRDEFKKIN